MEDERVPFERTIYGLANATRDLEYQECRSRLASEGRVAPYPEVLRARSTGNGEFMEEQEKVTEDYPHSLDVGCNMNNLIAGAIEKGEV